MKIYTRGGDKGETSLMSGERVKKSALRLEVYGTVDELSSFIGLAESRIEFEDFRQLFEKIQNDLYIAGADLSSTKESKFKVTENHWRQLEKDIDEFDSELEPLHKFILPGGSPEAALMHVCRTVARRAERQLVYLSEKEKINENCIIYLNRLSDLFFTMARAANKRKGVKDTEAGH